MEATENTNMLRLLKLCAVEIRPCRSCNATLYFMLHKASQKTAPYDEHGVNHFANCPHADAHRGRPA